MQLVRNAAGQIALVTTETARDLTGTMRHFAARRVDELASADLDGYVFKADSPSCGIERVAVVDGDTASRGLFAAALMSRLPHLPIVDERRLADPEARRQFIDRVFAHHQARQEAAGGGRATLDRRS
jgi:uncharacterized protein YbbK (DUF523 family)